MEKLITVATYDFPTNAEAAQLLLKSHGIRAFLADNNLVGMNWAVSNAVGGIKLQVAKSDVKQATDIIQQKNTPGAADNKSETNKKIQFRCTECGKLISFPATRRGHVEDCPHCGEYVDVPDKSEPTIKKKKKKASSKTVSTETPRRLWMELIAVLCLAYLPFFYNGLRVFFGDHSPTRPLLLETASEIVYSLQVIVPLLMIIALSNDKWSVFGIVPVNGLKDTLITLAVFFCGLYFYDVVYLMAYYSMGDPSAATVESTAPQGFIGGLLCLISCLFSGTSQELVMRGYLIPRFERLLGSTAVAVLISTALFASYHTYQGAPGLIASGVFGLIYAVAFCLTRRVWPLCAAHAINNWIIMMNQ